MTADRAALVEKIARAIAAVNMGLSNKGENLPDHLWKQRAPHASAALDIAMEEAAKVAETKVDEWSTEWRAGHKCDSHLEGKSDGAADIAAALRALKTKTGA